MQEKGSDIPMLTPERNGAFIGDALERYSRLQWLPDLGDQD